MYVLKDAMEHPENYGDLVVRVSGFSAYYTSLSNLLKIPEGLDLRMVCTFA